LTSNLVWYHYGLLSIPAIIVVLRQIVRSAARGEALLLGGILLWCLLLIGVQPIDQLLESPPNEHFLRCTIANVLLLLNLAMIIGASTTLESKIASHSL
jgi:hypothetical protein